MGLQVKIDRMSVSFGVFAAWLIVPLVLVICYEVTVRHLFGAATIWAHDVGAMLTGANFLLAIAYVTLDGGHIRVDILYDRFSVRTQNLIDLSTYLCIVAPFCIWLCWTLYFYFLDAWKTGETSGQSAWNPPLWPVRLLYFVAFVVLGLQAAREVLRRLNALRRLSGSDA
jgi:TRAP-type mannitol/chloroaromatic compound transport system permease small subunit